ncbi:unnamed protein product [Phytomonas sp. EM1]|nr:unnamed protein product [Phytomonas sp. EM1]|eukprot:CCW60511.1 unnamed protein product [Phytomonas sp. isolate EM1]
MSFSMVHSFDDIPPDAGELTGDPRLQTFGASSTSCLEPKKRIFKPFPLENIRNVSIIAHVDHGKTTLTDALLHKAEVLPADGETGTFTDRLRVERERGITVKAQTCSVFLKRRRSPHVEPSLKHLSDGNEAQDQCKEGSADSEVFLINLIDTPGHIDFQYEVSRSLYASEGVALLVDVNQGVQAQTMTHFLTALEQGLGVIPVLTKMDQVMSSSVVERTLTQLEDSTGLLRREVIFTSAKGKRGLEAFFQSIIERVPAPRGLYGLSDMKQLPPMHPDGEEQRLAAEALVPLRALLFDCWTVESGGMNGKRFGASLDESSPLLGGGAVERNGIYCLVRVIDGTVTPGTVVTFFHSRKTYKVASVGIIHPTLHPMPALTTGMVGYLFFPELRRGEVLIGDTFCTVPTRRYRLAAHPVNDAKSPTSPAETKDPKRRTHDDETALESGDTQSCSTKGPAIVHPIPGFKTAQPAVFASFYPDEGVRIESLREAVELLCVNDPAVTVEAVHCQTLGPGLQLGFLGLLHLQVFKERLLDEFGQAVLVTPPQVQYQCVRHGGDPADLRQRSPLTVASWRWPHEGVKAYLEPVVHVTVTTPKDSLSEINSAALSDYRAEQEDTQAVDDTRVLVRYQMPLAELARGFFSLVRSISKGHATLEYDDPVYVCTDLVKVDILINKAKISALSFICLPQEAHIRGRRILSILKEHINRSSTDLPLQAVIGNKIIARETIKAYRKDVTAKIHAGDITRKQKKWNDQKKGKERMARRRFGTVTLEQSVLAAAMGATSV